MPGMKKCLGTQKMFFMFNIFTNGGMSDIGEEV